MKKNIVLDENFLVEVQSDQFVLRYSRDTGKVGKKGNKILEEGRWYYGKLDHAFASYISKSPNYSESTDAYFLIKEFRSAVENVKKAVK